jgi:hypothetical protein
MQPQMAQKRVPKPCSVAENFLWSVMRRWAINWSRWSTDYKLPRDEVLHICSVCLRETTTESILMYDLLHWKEKTLVCNLHHLPTTKQNSLLLFSRLQGAGYFESIFVRCAGFRFRHYMLYIRNIFACLIVTLKSGRYYTQTHYLGFQWESTGLGRNEFAHISGCAKSSCLQWIVHIIFIVFAQISTHLGPSPVASPHNITGLPLHQHLN